MVSAITTAAYEYGCERLAAFKKQVMAKQVRPENEEKKRTWIAMADVCISTLSRVRGQTIVFQTAQHGIRFLQDTIRSKCTDEQADKIQLCQVLFLRIMASSQKSAATLISRSAFTCCKMLVDEMTSLKERDANYTTRMTRLAICDSVLQIAGQCDISDISSDASFKLRPSVTKEAFDLLERKRIQCVAANQDIEKIDKEMAAKLRDFPIQQTDLQLKLINSQEALNSKKIDYANRITEQTQAADILYAQYKESMAIVEFMDVPSKDEADQKADEAAQKAYKAAQKTYRTVQKAFKQSLQEFKKLHAYVRERTKRYQENVTYLEEELRELKENYDQMRAKERVNEPERRRTSQQYITTIGNIQQCQSLLKSLTEDATNKRARDNDADAAHASAAAGPAAAAAAAAATPNKRQKVTHTSEDQLYNGSTQYSA